MQQRRFEMGLPVARGRFGNQEKPPSCIVASSTAGTMSPSVLSHFVRRMATLKAVVSDLFWSSQRRFCRGSRTKGGQKDSPPDTFKFTPGDRTQTRALQCAKEA